MGIWKILLFPLISIFFGLTSEQSINYRKNLFTQIHEICFHGKGGYDYNTVYSMPIWLRKFTYHKMKDHYDEDNKKSDEIQNKTQQVKKEGFQQIRPSDLKQFQFLKK